MKPKKLIRKNIIEKLKADEWEYVTDQDELNKLYALKIQEELAEIQESEHKDVTEFADLIQVVFSFARQNGFSHELLAKALMMKAVDKGVFENIALNNLNPNNTSNALYFKSKDIFKDIKDSIEAERSTYQNDSDFNEGLDMAKNVITAFQLESQ